MAKRRHRVGCASNGANKEVPGTIAGVINCYVVNGRAGAAKLLDVFRSQRSLSRSVHLAVFSKKLESHQWRIQNSVLNNAAKVLATSLRQLSKCQDFDNELFPLVEDKIGPINGIGPL